MTGFRIKQIGLALGLMMSMLIGHASACTCSRHVDSQAADPDCRSQHTSTETVGAAGHGSVCEAECICLVNRPSPYAASKRPGKEFNAHDQPAGAGHVLPAIEVLAAPGYVPPASEFVNDLSYSTTLKSLLPSRAPPRL